MRPEDADRTALLWAADAAGVDPHEALTDPDTAAVLRSSSYYALARVELAAVDLTGAVVEAVHGLAQRVTRICRWILERTRS